MRKKVWEGGDAFFWGKSSKYDCNNQQFFINILKTVGDNIDKKIKYVKIYPGYKIYSNLK